ncbi:MAG TPA: hypothetical protein H9773_12185 [Candidatus Fournierella merdavium]|nr:hypothetical protein [Candidatus Fournierella merdavium]
MADKPTPGEFKTSLMGFRKAQVLAYIDEMSAKALETQKQQEEAAEALRKELESAKADNDLLLEKTKEVCDKLTSEEKRAGEAERRARAVSEQLLHMEETANGYKSRLFTKEQETVVLRADNARLTEELEQQHRQLEQARAELDAARAEAEEKARLGREELERQRSAFEAEKQADRQQMDQQREAAQRQLELEKARLDQSRRTQQETARASAQQMADTVLLLRSQLEQVDRQIADAADRLQKATGAIYTALGETEQNLVTLGAQAESFPKPLPEQPKARPRPERDKRPPRRPARRRTVSESLLDLLERALKE